jgi:hypothetical protein
MTSGAAGAVKRLSQPIVAIAGHRCGQNPTFPSIWPTSAATLVYTPVHRFEPHTRGSPVAALAALKKFNLARVFNDCDFGGYLIVSALPNSTAKNSFSTTTPPAD